MSPRVVVAVVGAAFLPAGLLILLLPLTTGSPLGFEVSCGDALGLGYDPAALEAQGSALPEICARLRSDRLTWALPVAGVGVLLLPAAVFRRRT